jgi:histidyl-tRNA synthetase
VEGDAEVLAVALDALRELGLDASDVRARVSDRRLLAALLRSAGVPDDRLLTAYSIVDKVEREGRDRILDRLRDEAGVPREAGERILALFDTPGIEAVRDAFGADPRVAEALAEVEAFLQVMEDLGFGDFVEFDLTIVRGLAYYTGIVFEVFDRKGEFRAICGGGRYDALLERVGGDPLPAVGFGMGDVVLSELLKERGLAPPWAREVDLFIVAIGEELRPLARRLAGQLRAEGRSVVTPLRPLAVRKQFQAASAEGAREVLVLGPDEVARGAAVLRTMADGSEREVRLDALAPGLRGPRSRGGLRDGVERRPARRRSLQGDPGGDGEGHPAPGRPGMGHPLLRHGDGPGGGALVAWILSVGTALPFRLTWAVLSVLLLVIPAFVVFGKEARDRARKRPPEENGPPGEPGKG